MINDTIRRNWVEKALDVWHLRKFSKDIKEEPNKALLKGLIELIFLDYAILRKDANWVDLSPVNKSNFFSRHSNELILLRLNNSLRYAKSARKAAFECLKAAYEEGFDVDALIPETPRKEKAKVQSKRKTKSKGQNLKQEWIKATLSVYKENKDVSPEEYPTPEEIESRITGIIDKLEKSFSKTISHKLFTTDDDVMEETDYLFEEEISNSGSDADRALLNALQIAITRLPAPKR